VPYLGNTELPSLLKKVYTIKQEASLLGFIDVERIESLIPFALAEIAELAESMNVVGMLFSLEKMLDEAMDIMVFFMSYIIAAGLSDEILHVDGHANGVAKRSDFLDVLTQTIGEVDASKGHAHAQERTRQEVYRLFVSMIRHFPGLSANAELVMEKTIRKVLANRSPEFYSVYENGRILNRVKLTEKYTKLEKIMRAMRDKVGGTLTAQDRSAIASIADDWDNDTLENLVARVNNLHIPKTDEKLNGVYRLQ